MSWRRLANLIRHLPRGSATIRAVRGEAVEWGPVEYLLADVFDVLAAANWQRANAGLPKGRAPSKRPDPYPRPGLVVRKSVDQDGMAQRLLEQRQRLQRG